MEIERRLSRRPLPEKDSSYRHFYWAVGSLYLEDLITIYDAIDDAIGELKSERAEDLAWWENLRREQEEHAKAWPAMVQQAVDSGVPMDPMTEVILSPRADFTIPEHLFQPLIRLQNEEHEFDSLDDVAGIHRRFFRQFEFHVGHPYYFRVAVEPPYVSVSVNKTDDETNAAVTRIDQVIRQRQYRVSEFLSTWKFWRMWVVTGAVIFALSFALDLPTWLLVLYGAIALAIVFLEFLPPVVLWLRKRAVVPKFRSDAETWWDKRGVEVVIGLLGLVLTAAGVAATVLYG